MKKTFALASLLLALRAWCEPVAGSLDVHWNEGADDCKKISTLAPLQVHQYEPQTYIIRQGLCVNFEAPLMYLLIGTDEALLIDTGAVEDTDSIGLTKTVMDLVPAKDGQKLPLLVLHSHGHGDHHAADAQFAAVPGVKVVPPQVAELKTALSLPQWPDGVAHIALGGRTVDVVAAPGHQPAHLIFYDDRTALLFTGDFLLPGRLMVDDLGAYRASAQRLVAFIGDRPVSHVLGAHIELDARGELFSSGSTYHPNERALALEKADVLGLPAALADFNGFYARHEHYVVTNPKRNLLTIAIGMVLLIVGIVGAWRMRRRKRS
ncbi:MAG TPA: MBL fold metallo-hydrolase [Steroidobacteraceae bacterium]|jgi:glyoxylase-like metal-dependent hydrolase (beta-lactamase superfamily II)